MLITAPGTTALTLTAQVVDNEGLPVSGLTAADFPPLVANLGAANIPLTLVDLTAADDPFTDGGVYSRGAGAYRFDVPSSLLLEEGVLAITGEAEDKRFLLSQIQVSSAADPLEQILQQVQAGAAQIVTEAVARTLQMVREVLQQVQPDSERTFAVGTRVRFTDQLSADYGRTATVAAVNGPGSYIIRFDDGRRTAVPARLLTVLPETAEPTIHADPVPVMARVRVTDPVHPAYNQYGTVLQVRGGSLHVQVQGAGGSRLTYTLSATQVTLA